jgi:hypothetical protein
MAALRQSESVCRAESIPMTAIKNPDWTGAPAAPNLPMGAQEAVRSLGEGPVRIVSDDGLEVVFRASKPDRHFDPAANDQIGHFAQDLARLCAERKGLPLAATLLAIAQKTQYRIAAKRAFKAKIQRRKRRFSDILAAIACILLACTVFFGAQRRLGEQQHVAVIAVNSISIDAPKSGYLVLAPTLGPVRKGDAVAGIRTPDGDEFVVEAPCSCQLAFVSVRSGEKVSKGKPLLKFWQDGTREFVSLRIQMVDALRLKSGASVELAAISSGLRRQFKVSGGSVSIQPLPFSAGFKPTGQVAVRIYPPSPLDLAAGEIVMARMRSSFIGGEPAIAQAAEGF